VHETNTPVVDPKKQPIFDRSRIAAREVAKPAPRSPSRNSHKQNSDRFLIANLNKSIEIHLMTGEGFTGKLAAVYQYAVELADECGVLWITKHAIKCVRVVGGAR